jgi:hypothetical protein
VPKVQLEYKAQLVVQEAKVSQALPVLKALTEHKAL